MRQFIITSYRYTGQATIIYDTNGLLASVDLQETTMTLNQRQVLLSRLPLHVDKLETLNDLPIHIIERDYEVSFEQFWNAYGLKINKKRAADIWIKMSKTNRILAYHSINKYNRYLAKENWRKKADADTYLKQEYFNNEYSSK
jgi:hypothetical protein